MASKVTIKKLGSTGNTGISTVIINRLNIRPNHQYIIEDSIIVEAPILNNGKLIIN